MTNKFRFLDRRTQAAVFFASLLIALCVVGSVTMAFGPAASHTEVVTGVEEVVVQG